MSPSEETKDTYCMFQFLKKHADTWLKFDLMLFWNKHPYTKFTSGAIARILNRKRTAEVEEVLDTFVHDEIVEKHPEQGLPFYCLTSDPDKRQFVLNIPAYRRSLAPAMSVR